jgi:hypothetical protein
MHRLAMQIGDPSIRAAYDAALKDGIVRVAEVKKIVRAALDVERGGGRAILRRISRRELGDLITIARHLGTEVRCDDPRCYSGLDRFLDDLDKWYQSLLPLSEHLWAAQVLENWSNVGRIHFTIDAVTFTGADYRRISRALRKGDVTLHTRPQGGGYNRLWNTLSLRPRGTWTGNMTMYESIAVHEATHAIEDFSDKPMRRWNPEVAAFLAEAAVLIARSADKELAELANDSDVFKYAEKAARASLAQPRDAARYEEAVNKLRLAIQTAPDYQIQRYSAGGEFGRDIDRLLGAYFGWPGPDD